MIMVRLLVLMVYPENCINPFDGSDVYSTFHRFKLSPYTSSNCLARRFDLFPYFAGSIILRWQCLVHQIHVPGHDSAKLICSGFIEGEYSRKNHIAGAGAFHESKAGRGPEQHDIRCSLIPDGTRPGLFNIDCVKDRFAFPLTGFNTYLFAGPACRDAFLKAAFETFCSQKALKNLIFSANRAGKKE